MAISQYPAGSQGTPGEYGNFTRHGVENAALYKARAVGDHATKLGACKALRERRYTPYFGVCHFNDSLFGSAAYRRARLSPPLQGACVCPAVGINRQCLPEIATGAKRPRNDKSGAITVLAIARANRSCSAGPGCPLPYSASSAASRHFPLTLLSPNRGFCRRPLPSRGDFFRAARPSYAAGS